MTRRNRWATIFVAGTLLTGSFVKADEQFVYFDTAGTKLTPKAKAVLKKLAKRIGSASVKLTGSSDPRGSEEINLRLRNERVQSVHDYLVSLGVPDGQIQADPGQAGEGAPPTYWKLRNVDVSGEFSSAPVVASKRNEEPVAEPQHAEPAPAKPAAKPAVAEERPAPREDQHGERVAMATTTPDSSHGGEAIKPEGTKPEKKLEPIRLIYWRALNHALWIVAKQKGFFADEGFDVDLVETDEDARLIRSKVSIATGVESTKALERGQKRFTAGAVCGFAVHEGMAKGEQIVDIGSMIMTPESLVMKKELADALDKDIRAFKDKKIGDVLDDAASHTFKYNNVLRGQLEKIGLKDNQDFKIIEYRDQNKVLDDLANGRLDVAKIFPPSDIEFLRTHPGFRRVPFAKFFPYLPCCRQLVTRAQLRDHRERYVRLLRASIRAHEFTIEHPREAAEIIGKWLHLSPSLVRQSIMSAYVTLTPDPMRKGVDLYQRTNNKFVGKKTSTAEFIDTSLYRDALFSLAKENSADPVSKGYYDTMISRFRANN